MSYDIWLEIDTGGEYAAQLTEAWNPTYNLAPMFTEALGDSIRTLDAKNAGSVTAQIQRAIADLKARPEHYDAMAPANGWGSRDGAITVLGWIADACVAHPKATIRVS
jgi:hypothetical protein